MGLALSCAFAQSDSSLEEGIALYQRESYEEALRYFRQARKEDPRSTRAAFYLGMTHKKMQDYKGARPHLTDAVTGSPKIREALPELIEVLYQLGGLSEAKSWIAVAEQEGTKPAQTAYLKGLVLLKAGETPQAVEAFKTAKQLDRSLQQAADYQIGLAYAQGESLPQAKEVLEEVVVFDPNSDLAAYAKEYLRVIERKMEAEKVLRASIGFSVELDDNVILKPSDVSTVGDVGDEKDVREVVTASIEWAKRIAESLGLKVGYSFYFAKQNDLGNFDLNSHTGSVVPTFSYGQGNSASLPLQYNYTWVADDDFLSTVTVGPFTSVRLSPSQIGQLSLRLQWKNFLRSPVNANEDRDAFRIAPGAGWFYLFAQERGFFGLRYEFDDEDADGNNWGYQGHRINATLLVPVTERLKAGAVGDAFFQNFENTHTTFGVGRDDNAYTLGANLTYEIWKNVELQFRYTHVRSDSNIALYDYDRNVVSFGVQYAI